MATTQIRYKLDHRHLIIDDVPKTAAFYENTLGAKRVEALELRGVPIVRLDLNGLKLTVSGPLIPGVRDHIGFEVDDFEEAMADLQAKGVEFVVQPTDLGFAKFAFIKDAAGTTLEVLHRTPK
jgi:catechol 2,3-dioxygenase-like lactoylglutathione lyase family enzyme